MAFPTPNVVIKRARDGRLIPYVAGVMINGATSAEYVHSDDHRGELVIRVLGSFVTFDPESADIYEKAHGERSRPTS